MEQLNGRMLACQIMMTALIARVANDQRDPLRFLTEYRDEVKAVIGGVRLAAGQDGEAIRRAALASADELFNLMKPPSVDDPAEGNRD